MLKIKKSELIYSAIVMIALFISCIILFADLHKSNSELNELTNDISSLKQDITVMNVAVEQLRKGALREEVETLRNELYFATENIEKRLEALENPPIVEIVENEVKNDTDGEWVTGDWLVHPLSDEDIELIAHITAAEAGDEPEIGKRLVIDVVLNRMESSRFPDTAHAVIFQKGEFSPTFDGGWERTSATDELRRLVQEESEGRLNSSALYFRTKHYHSFGTPLFNYGGHWFSK